jgi:hypothetical protein
MTEVTWAGRAGGRKEEERRRVPGDSIHASGSYGAQKLCVCARSDYFRDEIPGFTVA